jgi:hypothetical protein
MKGVNQLFCCGCRLELDLESGHAFVLSDDALFNPALQPRNKYALCFLVLVVPTKKLRTHTRARVHTHTHTGTRFQHDTVTHVRSHTRTHRTLLHMIHEYDQRLSSNTIKICQIISTRIAFQFARGLLQGTTQDETWEHRLVGTEVSFVVFANRHIIRCVEGFRLQDIFRTPMLVELTQPPLPLGRPDCRQSRCTCVLRAAPSNS